MTPAFILLIILTAVRLWTALQLFLTARKSNQNNLYWLAGVFGLTVYSLFTPATGSPLENPWVFDLGLIAGQFCLVMFIHTTFHRDRKSPVIIMMGLVALAFFVDIYAISVNNLNLVSIMRLVVLGNWGWHLVVAWSAYTTIAADPSVEKWVKARYRLMIVYILMTLLSSPQIVLINTSVPLFIPSSILLPVSILLLIGSTILQFLVWAMPEPFRLWLNREQQVRPVQDEQRPLAILDVFGAAMTADTGLQSMACLYAIRTTVSKWIGTEDSAVVRAYINMMTYPEWNMILQHSELRRILINGGADNASANKAIENARQALVEKQSLLTLSVR